MSLLLLKNDIYVGGEEARKIMATCFDRIIHLVDSYGIKSPIIFSLFKSFEQYVKG